MHLAVFQVILLSSVEFLLTPSVTSSHFQMTLAFDFPDTEDRLLLWDLRSLGARLVLDTSLFSSP